MRLGCGAVARLVRRGGLRKRNLSFIDRLEPKLGGMVCIWMGIVCAGVLCAAFFFLPAFDENKSWLLPMLARICVGWPEQPHARCGEKKPDNIRTPLPTPDTSFLWSLHHHHHHFNNLCPDGSISSRQHAVWSMFCSQGGSFLKSWFLFQLRDKPVQS